MGHGTKYHCGSLIFPTHEQIENIFLCAIFSLLINGLTFTWTFLKCTMKDWIQLRNLSVPWHKKGSFQTLAPMLMLNTSWYNVLLPFVSYQPSRSIKHSWKHLMCYKVATDLLQLLQFLFHFTIFLLQHCAFGNKSFSLQFLQINTRFCPTVWSVSSGSFAEKGAQCSHI